MGPPSYCETSDRRDRSSSLLGPYRKPRKCDGIQTLPQGVLAVRIKSRATQSFETKDQKGEPGLPRQSVRAATNFSLRRSRSTVGTLPQRAISLCRAENKALDE